MARIELRGVAHSYAGKPVSTAGYALKPLDLVWQDGGAYALLGPSGCGKTTLLNIMSGLLRPSEGSVWIDGRDVTGAPVQARNIAQVFQFPVVYDSMSVFDNLAFPLRNRGVAKRELDERVHRIAELLELGDARALGRRASGLSADMKQRISLGRGLVRKDVAAILLDEPLTVIDPHQKTQLRRKLVAIHRELNVTLVYVTHDQVEALTLADEVVVMNAGEVMQRGTPEALFERPAHTFVGYFIGSPGMNLLTCRPSDAGVTIDGERVVLPPALQRAAASGEGGTLQLGFRPEYGRLSSAATPGAAHFRAEVLRMEHLGAYKLVSARVGQQTFRVKVPPELAVAAGNSCLVELAANQLHLYRDGHVIPPAS